MTDGRAPAFAACDWGSTRLRVWLMDQSGEVLGERRSDEGMLVAATEGFAAILEKHLAALGAADTLPVIICGMAGARQGWIEAPYVFAPAAIHDVLSRAVPVPHEKWTVRIIPGIAQMLDGAPDVMRGEETQLAGATHIFGDRASLVCLPGTHCKWAEVEAGTVKRFSTWLTGELFSLLSTASILRHAVDSDATISAENPVFMRWLHDALARPGDMTASLFRIRAAGLLQGLAPAEAAAALSGLLIGSEIASARQRFGGGGDVVLIASGALGELYAEALRLSDFRVVPVDAEEAVRAGLFEAGSRNFLSAGAVENVG